MQKIEELNDLCAELVEAFIKENGEDEVKGHAIFNQRAKEIIKEIAEYAKTTRIYKEQKERREKFWEEIKDATPTQIYGYMLYKMINAPTRIHMNCSVLLIIPKLDELINKTEE